MRTTATSLRARTARRLRPVLRRTIGRVHDPDHLTASVRQTMLEDGLDPSGAERQLGQALRELDWPPFDHRAHSVHWLLFAALALERPEARVLEIGAYDGGFTALLASLFTEGEIDTVELPTDDPIHAPSYNRSDPKVRHEVEERLQERTNRRNITLHRCNSAFLLDHVHGRFDFVWVDGGHLFPEVAWDLAQTFHICRQGGAVLLDDVILPGGRSSAYVSEASREVLEYISGRAGVAPTYYLKRSGYSVRSNIKYVGLLRKPVLPPFGSA